MDGITREVPRSGKDETVAMKIGLSKGLYVLVDDEDYEWLSQWKWYASGTEWPYAARADYSSGRKMILMHRLLLDIVHLPRHIYCDHINGNTLDNRRVNLRVTDNKGNQGNRKIGGGTSVYRGVYYHKASGKWQSRIRRNRKLDYLGSFAEEADAARAYDIAAVDHFGKFAKLNFPDEYVQGGESMESVYFSIPEVTRMLRVSRYTVYSWIETGGLRASKWGPDKRGVPYRIERGDLLKFLSQHMVKRAA